MKQGEAMPTTSTSSGRSGSKCSASWPVFRVFGLVVPVLMGFWCLDVAVHRAQCAQDARDMRSWRDNVREQSLRFHHKEWRAPLRAPRWRSRW
jgi:hypothetical protein